MNATQIKVIPRTHKKQIASIFGAAKSFSVCTLDNGFSGETSSREFAEKALANGAKLVSKGSGRYTVQVHSNCWFDFTSAA